MTLRRLAESNAEPTLPPLDTAVDPAGTAPCDQEETSESGCDQVNEISDEEMLESINKLMRELKKDGGVWLPKSFREITATGDQAIVLAQILYWFGTGKDGRPRARLMKHSKRWLFKTHADLGRELGMKRRQIRSSLAALRDAGYIELAYFRANNQRTTHIRPKLNEICGAMIAAYQERPE